MEYFLSLGIVAERSMLLSDSISSIASKHLSVRWWQLPDIKVTPSLLTTILCEGTSTQYT